MDESQINTFLQAIGHARLRSNPQWVYTSCPLAPWTHPKGIDRNPSFGISIHPNEASRYNCFTCLSHGSLIDLLFKLNRHSGRDYSELAYFIQMSNAPSTSQLMGKLSNTSYSPPPPKEVGGIMVSGPTAERLERAPLRPLAEPIILPEDTLAGFEKPSGAALAYLLGPKRNLTLQTIEAWELLYHAKARRIAIPIRDCKQRLVGVTGRALYQDMKPKFLHSKGFQKERYLFGESKVIPGKTGYIVEGHFDAIYLWQMGYDNAVAIMGSSMGPIQVEKLIQFFTDIVIVPDGDGPGGEIAEKVMSTLKGRVPARVTAVPIGSDPDELSAEYLMEILGPPTR